ncbi:MAG TPA: hypothetical protein ENK44_03560 [Caldithrix abyssi]|uniref:Uncharacterized protein n=1 Tax=Caldithrix abyssi TaxID=187145 RepID=A0A7V4TYX9_CALAY|nr:hypothetical protein [Caldithrix abyssi]
MEDFIAKRVNSYKTDRRTGPDKVLKTMRWLGVFGWILVIVVFILFEISRPVITTFIDRWNNKVIVQPEWDKATAHVLLFIMYLGLTVSSIGIWLNTKRLKRKTDFYRIHFFFLGFFMFLGILYITLQIS